MTNLFETAEQTSNPERPAGSAPRFAVRLTTAIVAATVAAVVAGWWTPRGPVSSAQALATMAVGLTVGMIAGAAMRSRWAMVVASVAFIAIFELVRLGATGPTVDAISLTSTYGIMAFVVGRAFHGLLVLLPMVVGVAYGRVWSRRHNSAPPGPSPSRLRRAGRSIGKAAFVASTVTCCCWRSPPPAGQHVADRGGGREAASRQHRQLHMVEVGGHDQSLLIRGDNVHNPVLLFLAGGPGGSEVGAMSRYAELLERDFVVVTWDQLGTGRSPAS